jgi:DNA processing protein
MVREDKYPNANPYALWLCDIPGIGNTTIHSLMKKASSAEEVYHMQEQELCQLLVESAMEDRERREREVEECGLEKCGADGHENGQRQRRQSDAKIRSSAAKRAAVIARAQEEDPAQKAAALRQRGIGFTSQEDQDFPDRLRGIPDNPYGLYYIGALPREDRPSVAIVGARNCSGYGREQARIFAEKMAMRGITIVSGMARGVDGIAGRAAIEAGGDSYAVLGCGVDVVYPTENALLYQLLKEKGGILSEMPPGTQPRSQLFPKRNRLISGLSDAVLVIEARRRSGTVITVDAALEQGRDIFALPDRVCDSLSDGCNFLISQGAAIACTPETVVEHFYGVSPEGTDMSETNRKRRLARRAELDGPEAVCFDVLGQGDVMESSFLQQRMEFIIGRRISVEEFMRCMVNLQIRGLAQEVGMGHFRGI